MSFDINKTNQIPYFAKVTNNPQVETGQGYKMVHGN